MSQRLTRRQIKRDEVRETLGSGIHFLVEHWKSVVYAVVALGVGAGVRSYQASRELQASDKLARAVLVLQATIDPSTADPNHPDAPTFTAEADRDAKAEELLDRVQQEFSSTDAAAVASTYRGALAARQGDFETARSHWQEFVRRPGDHMLATEIRRNLMALDRQQGRGEGLAAELRSMVESGESPLPPDMVLFELAVTLDSLGDDGAAEIYRRLADDYPESPYAAEARGRTERAAAPRLGAA